MLAGVVVVGRYTMEVGVGETATCGVLSEATMVTESPFEGLRSRVG